MVELLERRVTRSVSNDLQNRAAQQVQQVSQQQAAANPQRTHSNVRLVNNKPNPVALSICNRLDSDSFSFEPLPYFRTTSEEILIRSFVDGTITQSTPSMDGLGLSSLPLASRRNSEELFSTWLSNSHEGSGALTSLHGSRQASGRMSHDGNMAALPQVAASEHQQLHLHLNSQKENYCEHNEVAGDQLRPWSDREGNQFAASHISTLQTLPWFHQNSHPMTRSRSAELRRMYAAMQGLPSLPAAETLQNQGAQGRNQAVASLGAFARGLANGHVGQSYSITQGHPSPNPSVNPISNMVNMLKGSLLERQLLDEGKQQKHLTVFGGSSSSLRALSPDESSGGAPSLSAGVALGDGPSSSEVLWTKENTSKRLAHSVDAADQPFKKVNQGGGGSLSSPRSQVPGDGTMEGVPLLSSSKGSMTAAFVQKPEQLTRVSSLISSGRSGLGLDKNNLTKMRRVERREKMVEAKGRPVLPSDLQVALKRCDALEKEVRSLKLTVSFMNRKDSEQTKRIEELEKENVELQQEKARLLEEVERLATGHDYHYQY